MDYLSRAQCTASCSRPIYSRRCPLTRAQAVGVNQTWYMRNDISSRSLWYSPAYIHFGGSQLEPPCDMPSALLYIITPKRPLCLRDICGGVMELHMIFYIIRCSGHSPTDYGANTKKDEGLDGRDLLKAVLNCPWNQEIKTYKVSRGECRPLVLH